MNQCRRNRTVVYGYDLCPIPVANSHCGPACSTDTELNRSGQHGIWRFSLVGVRMSPGLHNFQGVMHWEQISARQRRSLFFFRHAGDERSTAKLTGQRNKKLP